MKELSIEEKAQRYDEAVAHAKKLLKIIGNATLGNLVLKNEFETIFPELKESEDERIGKELIGFIKHRITMGSITPEEREHSSSWIAWLEKQGEQKPADLPKGEDYGIDGLWHAQRILESTLGKVDGYQSDDGILQHECAISAVKKLYEQKPAWSEEDEEMYKKVETAIDSYYAPFSREGEEMSEWFKNLKNRVQPQNTWKPSDEQMVVLNDIIINGHLSNANERILKGLQEQLKKLREE